MYWKTLLDDEAFAAGASTARALVRGLDRVAVLVESTSFGGGTVEPWLVIDTPNGEVELEPFIHDPTTGAWRKSEITVDAVYYHLITKGATWVYFKMNGGTGGTGFSLVVRAIPETGAIS